LTQESVMSERAVVAESLENGCRGPARARIDSVEQKGGPVRPSPLAVVGTGLAALVIALTGCTPAPLTPPRTASSAEATPTPAPSITPLVIGAAEMPPVAFDGDCAKALTSADIAEVTGTDLSPSASDDFDPSNENVGGLRCSWGDTNQSLRIGVIPRPALDGLEMPADLAGLYFQECGTWVCSWQGGDDAIWIAISFQLGSEMTRVNVDEWGAALGERIIDRHAASEAAPWERDRTGWWPEFACEDIAGPIGDQLGLALVGTPLPHEHLPAPEQTMAMTATRRTYCDVAGADGDPHFTVSTRAGVGGSLRVPPDIDAAPVDLGVPGITAQVANDSWFPLSDGVNQAEVYVFETTGEPHDIAAAVAAAAASGFQ
jgi:hypothetical protein